MTIPFPIIPDDEPEALPSDRLEAEPPEDVPLIPELIRITRAYGRVYAAFLGTATAIAIALSFLLPARYTATASLMAVGSGMPQGSLGRLSRLAGMTPNRDELSPETLRTILPSRRISDQVLDRRFARRPGDPHPLLLANLLSRTDPGEEPPRGRLYRQLARATRFSMDPETRIIHLAVETRYPYLSAEVANAYLEALSRYAVEEQQSRAQLSVDVIKGRIAEVKMEAATAERALHRFIADNQNYAATTDPDVRMEQLRLGHDLEIRTRMLDELATQYELALLEARNQAAPFRVIDRGAPPDYRSWPKRRFLVGTVFAASAVIGFALMLVADHLRLRSLRDARALWR